MRQLRRFLRFPVALLLAVAVVAPPSAGAQNPNTLQAGDLTLHFNAVPTRSLSAEVASQYGITRSASRSLLNVAVHRDQAGVDKAIAATVSAAATNLSGQRQDIRMREVREGDAIYYLGETRVADQETLSFEIEVKVDGEAKPLRASFQQQFFVEP